MMIKQTLTLGLWCLLPVLLSAQKLGATLKSAQREAESGHLLAAAELWEHAGRLRNADPTLLFQAAEAYLQARDYPRAGDCYRLAMSDKKFPLAALRFARALKQQGRYNEAKLAFETFGQGYQGAHKAVLMAVTENEIAGCNLAAMPVEKSSNFGAPFLLQDSVNSAENEFAPLLFSDKLLYFVLADNGQNKLMRTHRKEDGWTAPVEASSLPTEVSVSFRTGCFSSDGKRFYYAQGTGDASAESGGSANATQCQIFCLQRNEAGWMQPERLSDYINLPGSTAMFPHVVEADGQEYLFYSSDRQGGFGGLDLYVCSRPLASDAFDFSFPQNLGILVNTGADEVTPFFDTVSKTLWFSSPGHPSFGGMDVFFAEKKGAAWERPQNAGQPINSPADDYFFVLKKHGEGAFLASNRKSGKTTATDDDLFEINWQTLSSER